MYDIKALYEATSVPHAIELLLAHPEAKIIAGGSDVLVQMREGRLAGCELVSIYGLDELRGVTLEADGTIRIGSLTSFSHITKDPIIQRHIRVLGEAVDQVGGPQIRNIGTIGGNTCNGVTSADSASTLFAWDAEVELTGPDGVRLLPIQAFYIKAGKVDLRPGELQTAILIRRASYEGYQGHYIKYAMRNAMDIATTGCSVNVKLSGDGDGHRGRAHRLWRGRAGAHARAVGGGRRARQAGRRGDGGGVWQGGAHGREPAHELARQPGVPAPAGRGAGKACAARIHSAFGREDLMHETQYKLVRCTINGKQTETMVDVRASLTDMLRGDYRLTSVKKGCEVGECARATCSSTASVSTPASIWPSGRRQGDSHAGKPVGAQRRAVAIRISIARPASS